MGDMNDVMQLWGKGYPRLVMLIKFDAKNKGVNETVIF